jgi:hypothetical protein
MSNGIGAPSYVAGGNISPSRFVVMSGEFTVTQADATPGEPPIGISSEATMFAPNTPFDNGYAAISGYSNFRVYQLGDVCYINAGNTITGGDYLKPDANGRGIPATAGTYYGAVALETATASGQEIRCVVIGGNIPA